MVSNIIRDVFNRIKNNELLVYIGLNCVILIVLIIVLRLWNADLSTYPLGYGGDKTQVCYYFNTYLQDGFFSDNSRTGIPYISSITDFSGGGYVFSFVRWLITVALGNYVLAINFLFIISFLLSGSFCYYALRRMSFSISLSFMGATLYAFYPYHFLRGIGHFTYSFYWFVPLILYYVIYYFSVSEDEKWGGDESLSDIVFHVIMIISAGGHDVYFAYFTLFYFSFVILIKLIKKEKTHIWKDFFAVLGLFLVNCIPIVISRFLYGSNDKVAHRMGFETEYYGLKIMQLILPISGHRFRPFSRIRGMYADYPLNNENGFASLGLLMTIGFIFLLVGIFIKINLKERTKIYDACVKSNAATLLLCCIGGFASVISLFFAGIRCYNRISPYIAFFSLISLLIILEMISEKLNDKNFMRCFIIVLLIIGVIDQTTKDFIPKYDEIKSKWDSDEDFVSQIESHEERGAWIYQMPYAFYPERGTINEMGDYEQLTGVLHSDALKWSYGSIRGRESDCWYEYLQTFDVENQVEKLSCMGFNGIYIDRSGMGEEFENTLGKLERLLDANPIISRDKNLYYLSMKNYKTKDSSANAKIINNVFPVFSEGFYDRKNERTGSWYYWSRKNSKIIMYNMNDEAENIKLKFFIDYYDDSDNALTVDVSGKKIICNGGGLFEIDVKLNHGKNEMTFSSSAPERIPDNDDTRELCFCLRDFNISK